MKKIVSLIMVLVIAMSLCACGGSSANGEIGKTYTSDGVELIAAEKTCRR